MSLVIPRPEQATVPVAGGADLFPVHRIYCVGRNYAAHAREMGSDPDREPPFFFTKPADAVVFDGATIPFPSATADLHHEIELVAAIGAAGNALGNLDPFTVARAILLHVDGVRTRVVDAVWHRRASENS